MNDSQFLIIGANGQLGKALQIKYPGARTVEMPDLDISDAAALAAFDWAGTTTVLNAAAFTNVDGAETTEGRIAAWKANATAAANLARECTARDITLVHVSTDYVFDGTKPLHTETEALSPLGVYGQSKAAGDIAVGLTPKHYILRTSWVIGDGKNFVRTMLELGHKGINPSVVADQVGRLTFTTLLVDAIDHLLHKQAPFGIYNVSNAGESVSWAEVTRAIFIEVGLKKMVREVTTQEYYKGKNGIAPRPLQSTLDLSKITATGFVARDWRDDLKTYVKEELSR